MHEAVFDGLTQRSQALEDACSLHIKVLNCLKTVLRVNLTVGSEDATADAKVLSVQTIKTRAGSEHAAFATIRLRLEAADRLVYLGCRRQGENRNYETEIQFGSH